MDELGDYTATPVFRQITDGSKVDYDWLWINRASERNSRLVYQYLISLDKHRVQMTAKNQIQFMKARSLYDASDTKSLDENGSVIEFLKLANKNTN